MGSDLTRVQPWSEVMVNGVRSWTFAPDLCGKMGREQGETQDLTPPYGEKIGA